MLLIADVVRDCLYQDKLDTKADVQGLKYKYESLGIGYQLDEMIPPLLAIFDDCKYVNGHRPASFTSNWAWSAFWYRKSADAGNVFARLELVYGDKKNEERYRTWTDLLQKALPTTNYRAYYSAWKYTAAYDDAAPDPDKLKGEMWYYVGCAHHPMCDEDELHREMEELYLPVQVSMIDEAAEKVVEDPTSIDLSPEVPLRDSFR